MLQYVLCSPIWINVLNIYAFSNLHDFSWGTKEDGLEEDLGSAAANKDGTVELELPTDQADIGRRTTTLCHQYCKLISSSL